MNILVSIIINLPVTNSNYGKPFEPAQIERNDQKWNL